MIKSPSFQVRKRKWKPVLFLLRKRKRESYHNHLKPSIDYPRWHPDHDDDDDDDDDDERDVNPRNDVDRTLQGSRKVNPRLGSANINNINNINNDISEDYFCCFGVDERDENLINDVDANIQGFGKVNLRLGLDDDDDDDDVNCSSVDERDENENTRTRLGLDYVVAEEEGEKESFKSALTVVSERKKDGGDTPPDDDCCPICFDTFSIACKTNCGHWFCANCILQFWTYRTVLHKCNCPICARPISKLTPEASLLMMREVEVVEVLKSVQRYNRLFQGGINGVIRKVFEVPNIFKRMLYGLMDPDRFRGNYYAMRSFALLMSCIYNIGSFEFIPTGTLGVRRLFDLCAIALVVVLCLVGICHRLVLRQRVRRLAANQL